MWRTAPSPEISKLLILRNEQLDLAIEWFSVSHPEDQLILIRYGFELSKRYRIDNWHQIITHIPVMLKKLHLYWHWLTRTHAMQESHENTTNLQTHPTSGRISGSGHWHQWPDRHHQIFIDSHFRKKVRY